MWRFLLSRRCFSHLPSTPTNIALPKITSLEIPKLSKAKLEQFITDASYMYYNAQSPCPDAIFDAVKEELQRRDPSNKLLTQVGSPVPNGRQKEKLPYWMGSLDKITTEAQISSFAKMFDEEEFLITDKLDGVSGLLQWKDKKFSLFTRGNGEYGQNVSHIAECLGGIPNINNLPPEGSVRCELILSKATIKQNWPAGSANARNLVSGLVNSKEVSLQHSLIDCICHEWISSSSSAPSLSAVTTAAAPFLSPYRQILELQKLGFHTPYFRLSPKITLSNLTEHLKSRKLKSEYEIDGLVVAGDRASTRYTSGNPEGQKAFKIAGDFVATKVTDVEWTISKNGRAIPTVLFEMRQLNGSKVTRATGNNAGFIKKHNLGVGSNITLTMGGDIIPKIAEVLSPSSTGQPAHPSFAVYWSASGVDLMADPEKNEDAIARMKVISFFDRIDTGTFLSAGMGNGLLTKLFDAGFTTIPSILNITEQQLLSVPTIKEKTAKKILTSLSNAMAALTPQKLLTASNCIHAFGLTKSETLFQHFPSILNKEIPSSEMLASVFGDKTVAQITKGLTKFFEFVEENNMQFILERQTGLAVPAATAVRKTVRKPVVSITRSDSDTAFVSPLPSSKKSSTSTKISAPAVAKSTSTSTSSTSTFTSTKSSSASPPTKPSPSPSTKSSSSPTSTKTPSKSHPSAALSSSSFTHSSSPVKAPSSSFTKTSPAPTKSSSTTTTTTTTSTNTTKSLPSKSSSSVTSKSKTQPQSLPFSASSTNVSTTSMPKKKKTILADVLEKQFNPPSEDDSATATTAAASSSAAAASNTTASTSSFTSSASSTTTTTTAARKPRGSKPDLLAPSFSSTDFVKGLLARKRGASSSSSSVSSTEPHTTSDSTTDTTTASSSRTADIPTKENSETNERVNEGEETEEADVEFKKSYENEDNLPDSNDSIRVDTVDYSENTGIEIQPYEEERVNDAEVDKQEEARRGKVGEAEVVGENQEMNASEQGEDKVREADVEPNDSSQSLSEEVIEGETVEDGDAEKQGIEGEEVEKGGRDDTNQVEETEVTDTMSERENVFADQIFCFTNVRDGQVEAEIEARGGRVEEKWSKKINTLVVQSHDMSPTVKVKNAMKAGVKIIDLKELQTLISSSPLPEGAVVEAKTIAAPIFQRKPKKQHITDFDDPEATDKDDNADDEFLAKHGSPQNDPEDIMRALKIAEPDEIIAR